jgi:hypothetical protein
LQPQKGRVSGQLPANRVLELPFVPAFPTTGRHGDAIASDCDRSLGARRRIDLGPAQDAARRSDRRDRRRSSAPRVWCRPCAHPPLERGVLVAGRRRRDGASRGGADLLGPGAELRRAAGVFGGAVRARDRRVRPRCRADRAPVRSAPAHAVRLPRAGRAHALQAVHPRARFPPPAQSALHGALGYRRVPAGAGPPRGPAGAAGAVLERSSSTGSGCQVRGCTDRCG